MFTNVWFLFLEQFLWHVREHQEQLWGKSPNKNLISIVVNKNHGMMYLMISYFLKAVKNYHLKHVRIFSNTLNTNDINDKNLFWKSCAYVNSQLLSARDADSGCSIIVVNSPVNSFYSRRD